MGGLLRRMPSTGVAFLVGALAISALPPLSGFASEWTLLQALIAASRSDIVWLRRAVPLLVSGLALTGALAAACFVKAFGIAFLGLPRSEAAAHAHEVGPWRRAAQQTLAFLCVGLGLASPLLLPLVGRAGAQLGIAAPGETGALVLAGGPVATTSPLAIGLALAAALILLAVATHQSRARARASMTWACGLEKVEPRMQYTSSAFAKPIRLVFRRLFQPSRELEVLEGEAPYFVRRFGTAGSIVPIFDKFLYEPLVVAVTWLAARLEALASPSIETGLILTLISFCVALWWSL
jgi:hydrogenase-4 component B